MLPDTSGNNQLQSLQPNRLQWGMWNVAIDSNTSQFEIVPIRGAMFTANVTQFLQPPTSPTNLLSFSVDGSSNPSTGYFVVDVYVSHPFPGLNKYNGFDVRGIFMSDGSVAGIYDPSVLRAVDGDSVVENADGYTRWWNWTEFTSVGTVFGAGQGKLAPPWHPDCTVNPYKYFCDSLGALDDVTSMDIGSRGMFSTQSTNSRRYEIQFEQSGGNTVFTFNYAIDASWEEPDPEFAPNFPPEAYSISANCQEAFHLSADTSDSSAWYVSPSENGGELDLSLEIYDWQGAANGYVPGEINSIWLESDILPAPVEISALATISNGSSTVSSTYDIELGTLNLTGSGDYEIFATVESSNPTSYQPQVQGGENFKYPDAPLAGYFIFSVNVSDTSGSVTPTVTGIDPDFGIPDCTPEAVTVTGTNFEAGAEVRLEFPGDPPVVAENVVVVDSGTITCDLPLNGSPAGEVADVVVENAPGSAGVLPDAFTILEVLYVDGDNAGDPSMDGSADHPYDTIQKGIDAAYASADEPVIVDQAAANYSPFSLHTDSHVIGCNWNDGVGWAEVDQTNSFTYGNNINDATIEGLFFDITINSGTNGMYFNLGNGITLRGCKFSGVGTTNDQIYFVRFSRTNNIEVDYCEFTELYHRGPDTGWRTLYVITGGGVDGWNMHHSEFHDIGFDVPDAGAFGNSINMIRAGYETTGPHNIDFHNLLIYNIYDKTDCIRPSPNPDPQNYLSVFSLGNVNSFDWNGVFNIYNLTVDDIRHADPPLSTTVQAGHVNAMYAAVGGGSRIWKNNIASNIEPTDDAMVSGNSSYYGWWVDNFLNPGPSPQPMDYSDCFSLGKPLPPGANGYQWSSGYINQCSAGTGSYQNYQDIDPAFDMTPGDTFYHPTNTQVSQGADDGTEMGAFGGPEGDWIPPSQVW